MKYLIISKAGKEIPILIPEHVSERAFDELNIVDVGHVHFDHAEICVTGDHYSEVRKVIDEPSIISF